MLKLKLKIKAKDVESLTEAIDQLRNEVLHEFYDNGAITHGELEKLKGRRELDYETEWKINNS